MPDSRFEVSVEDGYILLREPPDYEIMLNEQLARLPEIAAKCDEAGHRKVLVLGTTVKVRMSSFEFFQLGKAVANLQLRCAIVAQHDIPRETMSLFENAATNRGSPLRFIDSVDAAKGWLEI